MICLALCSGHLWEVVSAFGTCSRPQPPTHPPPGADPERVKREIEEVIGLDCSRAIMASAKQVGVRL